MLTNEEKDDLLAACEDEIVAKVALKKADAASQERLAAWSAKNPGTPTSQAPPEVLLDQDRRAFGREVLAAQRRRDDLIQAGVKRGLGG